MFGTATPIRTACWGLAEFTNAFLRPEPALYPPRGITRFGRRRLSKSDFALLTAKIPETDPDCLGASGLTASRPSRGHRLRRGWPQALPTIARFARWALCPGTLRVFCALRPSVLAVLRLITIANEESIERGEGGWLGP